MFSPCEHVPDGSGAVCGRDAGKSSNGTAGLCAAVGDDVPVTAAVAAVVVVLLVVLAVAVVATAGSERIPAAAIDEAEAVVVVGRVSERCGWSANVNAARLTHEQTNRHQTTEMRLARQVK